MNREEWLNQMARAHIWPHLARAYNWDEGELIIPERYRISVGFPKGSRGGKGHAIGQAWRQECSADGSREVFISPLLPAEGKQGAVATLVHELIHVWDNNANKHKGPFRKLAKAAGLVGKMTATEAGDDLLVRIGEWIGAVGPYPHAPMSPLRESERPGSRLLKACCGDCGYTVRITNKWVQVGMPVCPCGTTLEAQ